MKIIGVTGGIGSGKSTVCRVFASLGIPVYSADDMAKELMHSSPELVCGIKNEFGGEIYSSGKLNRQALAAIVFNDPEKLTKLNELVHPAVAQDFEQWCSAQKSHIVLKEAAILFETGGNHLLDETVLVKAPKHERIKRVCARDGASEQEVENRMKNQWDDDKKEELADHVIQNHNGHLLIPQVLRLIEFWET